MSAGNARRAQPPVVRSANSFDPRPSTRSLFRPPSFREYVDYTVQDITEILNELGNAVTPHFLSKKEIWESGAFTDVLQACSFFGPLVSPPLVVTYGNSGDTKKVIKIKLLFRQNFVHPHMLGNPFVEASCPNRVFSYAVTFERDRLMRNGKSNAVVFRVRAAKKHIGRALMFKGQVWIFEECNICNMIPIWPTPVPGMLPYLPKY